MEGMLENIKLFVDELIVFKIEMMSTNFGRSLINYINMQSSRSLCYALKDIQEFEVVASGWLLAFVKTIKEKLKFLLQSWINLVDVNVKLVFLLFWLWSSKMRSD